MNDKKQEISNTTHNEFQPKIKNNEEMEKDSKIISDEEKEINEFLNTQIQNIIKPKYETINEISEQLEIEYNDGSISPELNSIKSWDELKISTTLSKALYMKGFNKPSKIQEVALPLILSSSKNLIAQAKNGSGKTATFALAMLMKTDLSNPNPQSICICHTRELAIQNMEVLKSLGHFSPYTYWLCVPQCSNYDHKIGAQIIVGTPGKIRECLVKRAFPKKDINMFVLDEADVLINRTSNVSAQVNEIRKSLNKNMQILLFSATYPEHVMEFVSVHVPNANRLQIKKEELSLSSISQFYIKCDNELSKLSTLSDLYESMTIGQSIIFVGTREIGFALAEQMKNKGHAVTLICGTSNSRAQSMDHTTREKVMREFRNGETKVLIATDILSRGIDIPQVTLVVNFDLPINRKTSEHTVDFETYIHRIGRTGRFGLKGLAISLVLENEYRFIESIQKFYQYNLLTIFVFQFVLRCSILPLENDPEVIETMLQNLRKKKN